MRSIVKHIRQSISWKLSLGILLMAIPIFMLSLGVLFVQSRNKVKREATKHAASVVNTTMQRINRYMSIVQTATDLTAFDVVANLQPDSLLAFSVLAGAFASVFGSGFVSELGAESEDPLVGSTLAGVAFECL